MTGEGNQQKKQKVPKSFCQVATISCFLLYKQNVEKNSNSFSIFSRVFCSQLFMVPIQKALTLSLNQTTAVYESSASSKH